MKEEEINRRARRFFLSLLTLIFIRSKPAASSVHAFIWWEIRRLIFNAFIFLAIIFDFFALYVFDAVNNDPSRDYDSALGAFFLLIFYFFIINIIYTFGWLLEMIYRVAKKPAPDAYASSLFQKITKKMVLLTAFPGFLLLFCTILAGFGAGSHQQPILNPAGPNGGSR